MSDPSLSFSIYLILAVAFCLSIYNFIRSLEK